MSQHGEVWVYAEVDDGKIADVSLELLGKGRELAGILGVELAAVLAMSALMPPWRSRSRSNIPAVSPR
jgi:electron transfer flavoprotein alpha subunit